MADETTPDFNLEGLKVVPYTMKLHDEDIGQTGYVWNGAVNTFNFSKHINEPQALFGRDPLRIDTIFVSTDNGIKSIGK